MWHLQKGIRHFFGRRSILPSMPDLDPQELERLRNRLEVLVVDLDRTLGGLSEEARSFYAEAEQSVIDARRKAETHEGLLQVN
ncbi:MAG TPA: hypothetical protein VF731_10210 [Solirubrobacterales bacterium]